EVAWQTLKSVSTRCVPVRWAMGTFCQGPFQLSTHIGHIGSKLESKPFLSNGGSHADAHTSVAACSDRNRRVRGSQLDCYHDSDDPIPRGHYRRGADRFDHAQSCNAAYRSVPRLRSVLANDGDSRSPASHA